MSPSGHDPHTTATDSVVGILLAAGEGRRFGRPLELEQRTERLREHFAVTGNEGTA